MNFRFKKFYILEVVNLALSRRDFVVRIFRRAGRDGVVKTCRNSLSEVFEILRELLTKGDF